MKEFGVCLLCHQVLHCLILPRGKLEITTNLVYSEQHIAVLFLLLVLEQIHSKNLLLIFVEDA